jgi:uncharacterized protein with von Willebrand factor type A (vWA) domain
MEVTLSRFVHALRSAEVEVSPAETLDGFAVVRQVGIADPVLLQDALGLALAKTRDEKARFADCFERFFHQLAFGEPAKGSMLRDVDVDGLLAFASGSGGEAAARVVRAVVKDERDYLAFVVQTAAERLHVNEIGSLREKGLYADALAKAVGLDELEALIAGDASPGSERFLPTLRYLRQYLEQQVGEYVDAQYRLHVDATGRRALIASALTSNLDQLSPAYYAEVDRVVEKLADRLARQHRRTRMRARRGVLDLKRVLRDNVAYDGALFDLSWRRARVQQSAVYVLCDVSGSVSRTARFLLLFLHRLVDALPRIRAFAFSDRLGEITELFERAGQQKALEEALVRWGRGNTDYGRALLDFRRLVHEALDHRATVIILGDARSNYYDPRVDVLRELSRRVGRVFWLTPESPESWGEGDSAMRSYRPYCHRVDVCARLKDIERFADRLLSLSG